MKRLSRVARVQMILASSEAGGQDRPFQKVSRCLRVALVAFSLAVPSMAQAAAEGSQAPQVIEEKSPAPTLDAVKAAAWRSGPKGPAQPPVSPGNEGRTVTTVTESDWNRDGIIESRDATATTYDLSARAVS